MTFEEIKQGEETYIMHTYGRFPIALDHGKGATLWDTDGKKYIDLTSGIGVNSLGHDNEALTTAVSEQAHKLMHACNLYYTEPMVQAAKKLVDAAGMGKIFFANSGAEANEGMIKLARKYSFDKYGEGRNKIITLKQSFHGRTVTTLKATGQDKFHQYFFPFTEGFDYAAANDIEDMKRKIDDTTCAVMMDVGLVAGLHRAGVLADVDAVGAGAPHQQKDHEQAHQNDKGVPVGRYVPVHHNAAVLQIIEVLDGRCHSYLVSINTSTTASSSSWLTKMV